MDGCSRQNPAYRPPTERPRPGGVFLLGASVAGGGRCRRLALPAGVRCQRGAFGTGRTGLADGDEVAIYVASSPSAMESSRSFVGECGPRGGVTGHTVDGAAGEGGGAPEVEAPQRRAVGRQSRDGPEHDLAQAVAAAADVAADEVAIATLEIGRTHHVASEDPGRGTPARTARPGPRCARGAAGARHSSRSRCVARACRPTPCACRRARARDRRAIAGRASR